MAEAAGRGENRVTDNGTQKTMREQEYDPDISVREAIERILSAALPRELSAAAPE